MVGGRDRRRQLRWLWPRSGLQTTFDQAICLSQTEGSYGLLIFIASCTSFFCLFVGVSSILITMTQGCLCCAGQARESLSVGSRLEPRGPYCHIWALSREFWLRQQHDPSLSATALRQANLHGSMPHRVHTFAKIFIFISCSGYGRWNNIGMW